MILTFFSRVQASLMHCLLVSHKKHLLRFQEIDVSEPNDAQVAEPEKSVSDDVSKDEMSTLCVPLSHMDFILGIADLTGKFLGYIHPRFTGAILHVKMLSKHVLSLLKCPLQIALLPSLNNIFYIIVQWQKWGGLLQRYYPF